MPQQQKRFRDKGVEVFYPVLIVTFFIADKALAQVGGSSAAPAGFNNFVATTITVVQGLALLACTLSFVRVGMKFNEGDPDAMRSLRNTGIGTAIVAGAAALLQFVKGFFASALAATGLPT